MTAIKRKPIEYLIPYFVATLIGAVAGLYLANYVFVSWQNLPKDMVGFTTIFKYKEAFGNIPAVAKAVNISLLTTLAPVVLLNVILTIALFAPPKREQHGSAKFANLMQIKQAGLIVDPVVTAKNLAKHKKEVADYPKAVANYPKALAEYERAIANDPKKKKTLKEPKPPKIPTPSRPSLLVGSYKGKKLEFFGNEFTFVAAPTRSGKGVGIVIPNLLHYTDSVVVLDIKNENWEITAGFRSQYQECFLFCPKAEDGRSHRYNPLDYISHDPIKRMGDIQNVANIMYPSDDSKDSFWQDNAQYIFTGLVLYMMETPERPMSLAELVKLSVPPMPLNEWIEQTINERNTTPIVVYYDQDGNEMPYREDLTGLIRKEEIRPLSVECVESLMAFAGNASENTRSSILSTMKAPLAIFSDPTVACATSYSDFRLDDVRKKRMSIYVGIQPNELPRFDKLLNLFFSQLISLNTAVLPEQDPSLKYQCLVLLDEFTALGKVQIISKSVAYIAGYNMRLMLIFQNKSQCEEYYGKEGTQTMLSNMACQIVFAPRTIDDAKSYSDLLGTETIKSKSISRNKGGKGGGGGSVSTSEQSRALMLPQELMEMDQSKEIVIFNANKPIQCDKIRYFNDPVFVRRAKMDIKPHILPPKLDVLGMLNVMRNVKPELVTDVNHAPKAHESLNTKHGAEQLVAIAKALDFDLRKLDIDKHPANVGAQKNIFDEYLISIGAKKSLTESDENVPF